MSVARQRAKADSLSCATSVPATVMAPASGRSMPAMRLSSVVLPDPDGPLRPRNSPSGTSSETSRTCTIGLGIAPLLHFDLGAAAQAVADTIDHLGAGLEPLADSHGRPHVPAHDHRY